MLVDDLREASCDDLVRPDSSVVMLTESLRFQSTGSVSMLFESNSERRLASLRMQRSKSSLR